MNVAELLSFQPDKPGSEGIKRKQDAEDERSTGKSKRNRKGHAELDLSEKDKILQLAGEEADTDVMDEMALKKMILQFEKRVYRNQEMRIKYSDMPEKFMESEVELNEIIQELHVVATVPDLYHILIELNAVQSLLQLLTHENTDISIAVVDLLQEMTDVDTLTESEEGANALIDALLEGQVIAMLVQNMDRLDDNIKEESEGVHNTLAIIENMTELRQEVCQDAVQQGIMEWLLKRLKVKVPFDDNKLYASEILAILLQNHEENRQKFGEVDGSDTLLQQLAAYKRHDPTTPEEVEMVENLFNCMCSALMFPANRDRFLRGEGLQLMNLMLREKKMSRYSAIKVLNHAMSGTEGEENCQKFVDILGLRSIFPLFMKTPKVHKRVSMSKEELEEHIVAVVCASVKNCQSSQRQRLLTKFVENDHEKVDRLMELHFKYLSKVRVADERIEREKHDVRLAGGSIDEDMEDQFYIQRLEAGLFTLQMVDYIMLDICASAQTSVKQRVQQILNMRGGSMKTIRGIMREYAGNIGEAKTEEVRKAEQNKIMQLLEKFTH